MRWGFSMASKIVSINRAPVLTLWAAVVAQRLGFDEDEALTLGRAGAGLNGQAKGRRLGIFKAHEEKPMKARGAGVPAAFWTSKRSGHWRSGQSKGRVSQSVSFLTATEQVAEQPPPLHPAHNMACNSVQAGHSIFVIASLLSEQQVDRETS